MSEQNMPERDPDYVCEDYGDVKAWTQIRVTVPLEQLDTLTALMSMISNNLMIEDYSDIETNLRTCYGDLIDEKILNADRTVASVSVYVPSDRSYADDVAFLRDRMAADGLNGKLELVGVNEEDWANNWKQYYKPLKIGNRIVICPAWETYTPTGNELVVRMDPGMAQQGQPATQRKKTPLPREFSMAPLTKSVKLWYNGTYARTERRGHRRSPGRDATPEKGLLSYETHRYQGNICAHRGVSERNRDCMRLGTYRPRLQKRFFSGDQ